MPGCKVGDVAWVSKPTIPENYGKICEITGEIVWEGQRFFSVRFPTKLSMRAIVGDQMFFENVGHARDEQLTPIRGGLTKEQMERENLWSTKDEQRTIGA